MLRDEITTLVGKKRKFFLLRICDVDTPIARSLAGVKDGTYNSWLQDKGFVTLYRRRKEFAGEYKEEAIKLLRRDNQLNAVLLEEKILARIKEEIESGEYSLVRLPLARDVYAKLINDLDYQPQSLTMTWEQKLAQLNQYTTEGSLLTDGSEDKVIEATSRIIEEHTEGQPVQEGEPQNTQVEEKLYA